MDSRDDRHCIGRLWIATGHTDMRRDAEWAADLEPDPAQESSGMATIASLRTLDYRGDEDHRIPAGSSCCTATSNR